ncbi:MAG: SDR family NAD(P)-dependent oxidoreductase [Rhodothermia bacterium]|nr:MAG: SDR family NAD(P)-dependent oxidoreductase [Rhodothermia bacterium]
MVSLQDQIVFVTGASSGIGAACVGAFAGAGARVIVCARRIERLREMVVTWEKEYGTSFYAFKLDISDHDAVQKSVKEIPREWQEIDILVNNAGKALGLENSYQTRLDHLDGMMDTNVKGLLYVNGVVIPGMIERNRGHIIHIGSVAGRWVYPGGTIYCATKHAVRAINEGLKMDLHGTPIRVSSVDPGLVETEFSLVRFEGDAERAENIYAGVVPLTAVDVADAVMYCATRPPHVNINEISLMCVDQSAATMVRRRT